MTTWHGPDRRPTGLLASACSRKLAEVSGGGMVLTFSLLLGDDSVPPNDSDAKQERPPSLRAPVPPGPRGGSGLLRSPMLLCTRALSSLEEKKVERAAWLRCGPSAFWCVAAALAVTERFCYQHCGLLITLVIFWLVAAITAVVPITAVAPGLCAWGECSAGEGG